VLAGFQMAAELGAIVGPVLAGMLAERVGFATAFAVTGAVALVAFGAGSARPRPCPGVRVDSG
jgi:DHA1 family tetracycline resistance protein-like MFS transporter